MSGWAVFFARIHNSRFETQIDASGALGHDSRCIFRQQHNPPRIVQNGQQLLQGPQLRVRTSLHGLRVGRSIPPNCAESGLTTNQHVSGPQTNTHPMTEFDVSNMLISYAAIREHYFRLQRVYAPLLIAPRDAPHSNTFPLILIGTQGRLPGTDSEHLHRCQRHV